MMQSDDASERSSHRVELERQLRRDLRTVVRRIVRVDMMAARRLGIHATDLATMDLLHNATSPVTPRMLADHLGISSGSATAAIDRLERAGYVRRVPNPSDRRGIFIEPVEDRQERLQNAYQRFARQYEDLTSGITDDEVETVLRLLRRI